MPRSGLQQDVINLYRQGMKTVMAKPKANRDAFLLHLRFNFHNPPLRARDYTAIEHRLRKVSRTIEMLDEPSVSRISVGSDMQDWWASELNQRRQRASSIPAAGREGETSVGGGERSERRGGKDVTHRGGGEQSGDQWGGTLPGHGGT